MLRSTCSVHEFVVHGSVCVWARPCVLISNRGEEKSCFLFDFQSGFAPGQHNDEYVSTSMQLRVKTYVIDM